MPRLIHVVALLSTLAACDSARVDRTSQAATGEGHTLAECVAMLAVDVHAACTDVGPAPTGPGTAPSDDGFVGERGADPFASEAVSADEPAPLSSPGVDVHCAPGDVPGLAAARGAAFRACVRDRTDPGAGCASIADVPCPPGLNDAECDGVRDAAGALCADELASL